MSEDEIIERLARQLHAGMKGHQVKPWADLKDFTRGQYRAHWRRQLEYIKAAGFKIVPMHDQQRGSNGD